jgi:hypothetical protein
MVRIRLHGHHPMAGGPAAAWAGDGRSAELRWPGLGVRSPWHELCGKWHELCGKTRVDCLATFEIRISLWGTHWKEVGLAKKTCSLRESWRLGSGSVLVVFGRSGKRRTGTHARDPGCFSVVRMMKEIGYRNERASRRAATGRSLHRLIERGLLECPARGARRLTPAGLKAARGVLASSPATWRARVGGCGRGVDGGTTEAYQGTQTSRREEDDEHDDDERSRDRSGDGLLGTFAKMPLAP